MYLKMNQRFAKECEKENRCSVSVTMTRLTQYEKEKIEEKTHGDSRLMIHKMHYQHFS